MLRERSWRDLTFESLVLRHSDECPLQVVKAIAAGTHVGDDLTDRGRGIRRRNRARGELRTGGARGGALNNRGWIPWTSAQINTVFEVDDTWWLFQEGGRRPRPNVDP